MEYEKLSLLISMMFCATSLIASSLGSKATALGLCLLWLGTSWIQSKIRWKYEN